MDVLTTAVAIVLLLFVLRGAWRGLTGELAPLVGLVACGGILWLGYPPLHVALGRTFPGLEDKACVFYAALVVSVLGMITFFLLANLVKRVGVWVVPQPFNALLGALIGGGKALLLIGVAAGLIAVAQDRVGQLCGETERNPVSAAAVRFWADRFAVLADLSASTSEPPATSSPDAPQEQTQEPANARP